MKKHLFKEQVVWITGASSGIGEAFAKQVAARGSKIVLSSRNESRLQQVKQACIEKGTAASDVLVLPLDITKEADFSSAVEKIVEQYGRIDMLLNNAGISQRSLCTETDMSVYRTLFEVDVFGQIALTKRVLPLMIKQNSGHILVTASVAGKVGVPYRTGYCAAKHAIMGFFDALRAEMANTGIRVTTITPGFIRTNLSENALNGDGTKFGVMDDDIANGIDADICASKIIAGIERGNPEIVVAGSRERQALFFKRFFPKLLFKVIAKVVNKPKH